MSAPPFPRRVLSALTGPDQAGGTGLGVSFRLIDRWQPADAAPAAGVLPHLMEWSDRVTSEPELCYVAIYEAAAASAAVGAIWPRVGGVLGRETIRSHAVAWIAAHPGTAAYGWHAVIWFDLIGPATLRPKPVILEVPDGAATNGGRL